MYFVKLWASFISPRGGGHHRPGSPGSQQRPGPGWVSGQSHRNIAAAITTMAPPPYRNTGSACLGLTWPKTSANCYRKSDHSYLVPLSRSRDGDNDGRIQLGLSGVPQSSQQQQQRRAVGFLRSGEVYSFTMCAHNAAVSSDPSRDQVPGHTLHRINEWQQSPVPASLHHLLNTVQALVSTLFRCPHPVTTFKTPINLNKSF